MDKIIFRLSRVAAIVKGYKPCMEHRYGFNFDGKSNIHFSFTVLILT